MEVPMLYCPQCRSEYVDTIKKCSDCNVDLVEHVQLENKLDTEDYVEVYVTNEILEMELIQDLLNKNEIHCTVRDLHMSSLPMTIGEMAEMRIEVAKHNEKKAKDLIEELITSGVVSDSDIIDEA